jgi:hypothetical protein
MPRHKEAIILILKLRKGIQGPKNLRASSTRVCGKLQLMRGDEVRPLTRGNVPKTGSITEMSP